MMKKIDSPDGWGRDGGHKWTQPYLLARANMAVEGISIELYQLAAISRGMGLFFLHR